MQEEKARGPVGGERMQVTSSQVVPEQATSNRGQAAVKTSYTACQAERSTAVCLDRGLTRAVGIIVATFGKITGYCICARCCRCIQHQATGASCPHFLWGRERQQAREYAEASGHRRETNGTHSGKNSIVRHTQMTR